MGPFGHEESHVGPVRIMAPGHPRMVDLEPSSPSSLGAVAGSIGKYLDREYWKSAHHQPRRI